MSFEAEDFFKLAEELLKSDWRRLDPAARRSAISRAYYAAFLQARAKAAHEGRVIGGDENAHKAVGVYFREHPDNKYKEVGELLRRLRTDRNDADYDEFSSVAEDVETILETARRTLSLLRSL